MDKVTFLTCGGTIDKEYGTGKGVYDFHIGEPAINKIINKFYFDFETEVIEILKKDSLDIDDNDRLLIKNIAKDIKNDKLIITHGSDTMVETGKILQEIKDKVIVIVGSRIPMSMRNTDTELNIGFALGVLDILSSTKQFGVYIAMNLQYFDINNVRKFEDGVFRKIRS